MHLEDDDYARDADSSQNQGRTRAS